jgi:hypothetical protein
MALFTIDRQVTSGRPPGVDPTDLREASVVMDIVGKDLAVLLDVLSARVYDVEPGGK